MPNPEWREKDISILPTRPDKVVLWLNELLEYTNELESELKIVNGLNESYPKRIEELEVDRGSWRRVCERLENEIVLLKTGYKNLNKEHVPALNVCRALVEWDKLLDDLDSSNLAHAKREKLLWDEAIFGARSVVKKEDDGN